MSSVPMAQAPREVQKVEQSANERKVLIAPAVANTTDARDEEWVVPDPNRPRLRYKRRWGEKSILGNSCGCCGNNCVFPQDAWKSIFIACIVIVPVIVFLTSVVHKDEWWSFLIVGVFAAGALLCNYFAVSIDPGIIPPAGHEMWNRPDEKVIINGKEQTLRICPTCYVPKPPRSSHCPACDYCVEDYDHHCGVLGSCVAKRTFRFFGGFFIFCTLLAAYVFVRCVVQLSSWDISGMFKGTSKERWQVVAALLLCMYTAATGCTCLGFAGSYINMACERTNKKQIAHHTYDEKRNTLDTGSSCTNCCETFFGPLGHSRV